ncbi:amyloid fiber anchoring/assembly protein TapA, partial [Candidatus Woesebacteria bacterium RBG_19FT_COMBO_37_29]
LIPAVLIILGELLSLKNEIKDMVNQKGKSKGLPKLSFSFKSWFTILLVLLSTAYFGVSGAYFSDTEGSSASITTGTWEEPVPTPSTWDKSSLYFDEEFGCKESCEEVRVRVCNGEDAEDMQGTSTWELYFAEIGNPKDGEKIANGIAETLTSGECQELSFVPTEGGNYMFKAYQRPGHPGTGELWSEACEIEGCLVGISNGIQFIEESPTPLPTPTEIPTQELSPTPFL